MPTPLVPSAASVTVSGTYFGQLVQNVWHVTTTDPPTVEDLEGINAIFQTAYGALAIYFADSISWNEITSRYLGDIGGPEVTLVITPAQTGGDANQGMPGNVALCVSLRTALAGRRFRGRKYFSGIPTPEVEANTVTEGFAEGVVAECQNLIDALFTNGTPLSVLSYVGPTIVPVITALVTDRYVDSQRRRLTGRGR